tara:strand:- start:9599 stop:10252 length:654 start_codon:yes stop_codon:yes gene_type:complete
MISAMAENRVIGNKGKIPWSLSSDLKRFKTITYHHPVIMGRKTYESIGDILYGRKNIIITKSDKDTTKAEILKKYTSKLSTKESQLALQLAEIDSKHKRIQDEENINGLKAQWNPEVYVCNSKEEALETVGGLEASYKNKHDMIPFVIGGRQIYKMFMSMADRLFITLIHGAIPGDVRFPTIREKEFTKISDKMGGGNPKHSYIIFERHAASHLSLQ